MYTYIHIHTYLVGTENAEIVVVLAISRGRCCMSKALRKHIRTTNKTCYVNRIQRQRYENVWRKHIKHVDRKQRKRYEHVARQTTVAAADKARTMMPLSGLNNNNNNNHTNTNNNTCVPTDLIRASAEMSRTVLFGSLEDEQRGRVVVNENVART